MERGFIFDDIEFFDIGNQHRWNRIPKGKMSFSLKYENGKFFPDHCYVTINMDDSELIKKGGFTKLLFGKRSLTGEVFMQANKLRGLDYSKKSNNRSIRFSQIDIVKRLVAELGIDVTKPNPHYVSLTLSQSNENGMYFILRSDEADQQ